MYVIREEDPAYGVIIYSESGKCPVKTRVYVSRMDALIEAAFVNLAGCGVFAEAVDDYLRKMEPKDDEKAAVRSGVLERIAKMERKAGAA